MEVLREYQLVYPKTINGDNEKNLHGKTMCAL